MTWYFCSGVIQFWGTIWLKPLVNVRYMALGSEPFFIGASQNRRAVGRVPAFCGVPWQLMQTN